MKKNDISRMVTNTARIIRQLEDLGIRVEIGADFTEYAAHRRGDISRAPIYPMFDPAASFIDETNGLWICGFDAENKIVHTQAGIVHQFGEKSLMDHLRVHRQKYITPGTTPDPEATFFHGHPEFENIKGRVSYTGDFWLAAKGLGGARNQSATILLSRLFLEIITRTFELDHIFSFIPTQLAVRGLHMRYGFSRCEKGRWIGPDQQITEEEYIGWMNEDYFRVTLAEEVEPLVASPRTLNEVLLREIK